MEKTTKNSAKVLFLTVATSLCLTASLRSTEVTTTQEIKLPLLSNGQSVGYVTLPAGSTVETDGKIAPDGTVLITRGEMSSRVEAAAINLPKTSKQIATQEKIKAIEDLADRGDAVAQNKMGMIYKHGWGVQQDDKKAIAWFQRSAYLSNLDGERNLASMLKRDPKNLEKANKLLAQAALLGDKQAEKILRESLPTSTPEESLPTSTPAQSPTNQTKNQIPQDSNQAPLTDNAPKPWAFVNQKTGKAIGLKEKTEAEKKVDALNDALGLPLFSQTPLLEESPESVAARLNLPKEAETTSFCSFSQYYERTQAWDPWTGPILADTMVSSITLEAEGGKTTSLSLVMDVTPNEGGKNFEAVQAVLTKLFGPSKQARFGPKGLEENGECWTNASTTFFLLRSPDYAALRLLPSSRFDDPQWDSKVFAQTKRQLPSRVMTQTNGDTLLAYPMGCNVDETNTLDNPQTPARVTRNRFEGMLNLTRYYGLSLPIDQLLHGGSLPLLIQSAGGRLTEVNLGIREIKNHIQAGNPIFLQRVAFTPEMENRLKKRGAIRADEMNQPSEWIRLLESDRNNLSQLGKEHTSTFLPVLILGCNEKTRELALADFSTTPTSLHWLTIEEIQHSNIMQGKAIE